MPIPLLSTIAANPQTSIAVASILAKIGAGITGRNDLKKAQRKQAEIIKQANLSRAFGGNPAIEQVQVQPGKATNFLSLLGQGLDAGGAIYGAHKADKAFDLQMQGAKLANQGAQDRIDIQRGSIQGAGASLPKVAQSAPQAIGGQRTAPGAFHLEGGRSGALPGSLESAAFNATVGDRTMQRDALQRALGQQGFENSLKLSANDRANTMLGMERAKFFSSMAPAPVDINSQIKQLAPIVQNAAEAGDTWQQVTARPAFNGVDIRASDVLLAQYESAKRARLETQNKELSDFLYGDLKGKFSSNEILKKSGDLIFGMNLMDKGVTQQNGVGDLMMVNAMVRLSDPGVSVRPMEALQMEEVGGLLEKWGVIATGEKFMEGNKFTPAVRSRLLSAATDLYGGQIDLVNNQLSREVASAIPRVLDLTGQQDPQRVPGFMDFIDTYRLPSLNNYISTKQGSMGPQQETPAQRAKRLSGK